MPRPTRCTAHIINHTHWDREWFLTADYTTPWIPGLIDRVADLTRVNPGFRYFLDGQTLVIEDLLRHAPLYRAVVDRLVRSGNLHIGPYYCQPDWRLTGGEALLRNLLHGWRDMQRYGARTTVGWLVDTFGHISQAPQLHRLLGIGSVFIWRGVPHLEPYFRWQGADGTELFAIQLPGGYRNLYGVVNAPELAVRRLKAEIDKLQPFYPTPDIPLFDGYDLETNPEDPFALYHALQGQLPPGLHVQETTPGSFADFIRPHLPDLPDQSGELMSGKHAAVFPGTLSARTYLKVMARDCEYLLYQVCEPLGALACLQGRPYPAKRYEEWSRTLLQNAVHDCLCGVSVDLVHAKMEVTYRQVFEDMQADLQASLASIFQDFAPGPYALSANPFACEAWQPAGGQLFHVQTQGIGVWKVLQTSPIRETRRLVESFQWKNAWYEARLLPGGQIQVGQAFLGALAVFEDRGDAYSEDTGPLLGTLQPDGPMLVEQESDGYALVTLSLSSAWEGIRVSAVVRLTFDPSPLLRWQIDLDSRGSGFRVEAVFETARMGAHPGQVVAGMPFDVVLRPTADRDLLPRQLEGDLGTVLMGQREIGSVETFPFHDFVGVSGGSNTAAVLTKGLHAYLSSESGTLRVTLRRAVEWLAKPDLATRVGDAGPLFYVPDARCERAVTHELAFLTAGFGVEDMRFHALNTAYQNPPLLVQSHGAGSRTEWGFFQENLPASSMQVANGRVLVRLYNPTPVRQPLSRAYLETDVFGNPERTVQDIPAKGIITLEAAKIVFPSAVTLQRPAILANPPVWRVGPNQGNPDPAVIRSLGARAADLECQIGRAEAGHTRASGLQRYRWLRRIYSLQRQLAEIRLSIRVNEIKLVNQDRWTRAALDTPDPEVAEIGSRLNRLRSQRRIYDYIVQLIPGEDDMRDE